MTIDQMTIWQVLIDRVDNSKNYKLSLGAIRLLIYALEYICDPDKYKPTIKKSDLFDGEVQRLVGKMLSYPEFVSGIENLPHWNSWAKDHDAVKEVQNYLLEIGSREE